LTMTTSNSREAIGLAVRGINVSRCSLKNN
jgi:hypothetical protein